MAKTPFLFNMDPEDRELLRAQAEREKISMAEVLRKALREYVERHDSGQPGS